LTRCDAVDIYRLGDGIQQHWLTLRYPFKPWRWLACIINPLHLVNLMYEQRLLGKGHCKYLITNSQLCKKQAQQYYRVPSERIEVIYNGVDQEVFSPATVTAQRQTTRNELGLTDDAIVILYVSNNWQRKGLAVLLEAVALLDKQGGKIHVVVVGRGRPEAFRRLLGRLGLAGRVHFAGVTKIVERYYAAGDLFVLPTIYDPFANVCLEAMACGLPVITTSGNGAAELLTPGTNGYIQSDPFDASELSSLLGKCLDPAELRRMGAAAHASAIPFTRERNMQQALAFFRRSLG
jgi:UDP-glucose:(heptosyl)LPS alpha-1,3-glucosyltransferase